MLAEQLKWSRFVNTGGLPGHNISCDLHNEHLNRLVKIEIEGLGANKSKKVITRSGKAIGVVTKAVETLDVARNSAIQNEFTWLILIKHFLVY